MWGYQDGVPCLGYICRMIQNNIIIFRVYNQSLFITKGIRPSFIVTVPGAYRFTRTHFSTQALSHAHTFSHAHSFISVHFHTHAISQARTSRARGFTHTHFHTHAITRAHPGTPPPLFTPLLLGDWTK